MSIHTLKSTILLLSILCLYSCKMDIGNGIDGKGPIVEKEYTLEKPFDKFSARAGWEVELIKSDEPRLVVRTQENLIPIFEYKIKGNKLSISNKENIGRAKLREVKLYYQNLSEISASSGSEVSSNDIFEQEKLTLSTSSGAEMELQLKTQTSSASTSSGSEMELRGTSINFTGDSSSGSELDAENLKTKTSKVKASSGASMEIHAIESLSAKSSSGGTVDYYGDPKKTDLNQSISGGKITQE